MAIFSWAGTAWNTAGPEAGEHEDKDDDAFEDDQPHRVGPGHLRGDGEGDEGVEAQAGRQRQREVGDDPHEDRHQARDQSRARRDRRQVRRGTAAEELPLASLTKPRMSGLSTTM
jgi:hypothetical protein